MTTLKVGSSTIVQKLAGSIAINIRQSGMVCLTMVGASALNKAIKGLIIARRYLKEDGNIDLTVQPSFIDMKDLALRHDARYQNGDEDLTGIQLLVKKAEISALPTGVLPEQPFVKKPAPAAPVAPAAAETEKKAD